MTEAIVRSLLVDINHALSLTMFPSHIKSAISHTLIGNTINVRPIADLLSWTRRVKIVLILTLGLPWLNKLLLNLLFFPKFKGTAIYSMYRGAWV